MEKPVLPSPGLILAILLAVVAALLAPLWLWPGAPEWAFAVPGAGLLGLAALWQLGWQKQVALIRFQASEQADQVQQQQHTAAEAATAQAQLTQQNQQLSHDLALDRQTVAQQTAQIGELQIQKTEVEKVRLNFEAQLAQTRDELAKCRNSLALTQTELAATQAHLAQTEQQRQAIILAQQTLAAQYDNLFAQAQFGLARFEVSPPVSTLDEPDKQIRLLYQQARLTECNAALAAMSGYATPAGMEGMRFGELFKNPQGKHTLSQLREMLAHGHRFTDADGLEADEQGQLIRYQKAYACTVAQGQITEIWFTKTDISRLRDEQAQLSSQARFYRLLTDNQAEALAALDDEGYVKYLSPGYEAAFGPLPNPQAQTLLSLFHPEDAGAVLKAQDAALAQPDEPTQAKGRLRHANGQWLEVELTLKNCLAAEVVGCLVVNLRDVTGRNQAQRRAAAREALWQAAADALPHPLLVADANQRQHLANTALRQLVGGSSDWLSVAKEDEVDALLALPENSGTARADFHLRPATLGVWQTWQVAACPLQLDNGHPGALYFLQEVTDEREAQRQAKLQHERWQGLAHSAHEAICLLDAEGELRLATLALAQHLDMPIEPGFNFKNLLDADGLETWEEVLRVPGSSLADQFNLVLPNGEKRWVEARFTNHIREESLAGVTLAFRQNQAAKDQLEALRLAEFQLRTVCEHTPVYLGLAGPDGAWQWHNRGAQSPVLALEPTSWADLPACELTHAGAHYACTLAPVAAPAGTWVVATAHNIDQAVAQRQALASQAQAQQQAEAVHRQGQAEKAATIAHLTQEIGLLKHKLMASDKVATVGRLAAGTALGLHQPATMMSGQIPQLADDVADLKALIDKYGELHPKMDTTAKLQEIDSYREMLGVDWLYRDLNRRFSDLQANTDQLASQLENLYRFADPRLAEPAPVDFNRIIEEALALVAHKIDLPEGAGKLLIRKHLAPGLTLRGKAGQLAQLCLNLLENALDALAGRPQPQLEIGTVAVPNGVQFTLIDNGPGLPPAAEAQLFQPFFTTKDPAFHLGLGLFLAREIATQHQGEIRLANSLGGGTRVEVVLLGIGE
jgi:PAS domain S-box-containing protein